MKIAVLIPSEEYKNYAGARIRYGRLKSPLERLGIRLVLEDIATFSVDQTDFDAILISKCHDARSLVAAAAVAGRGLFVGVDLFDDYFSQKSDSRLARYRNWLSQLLPFCQFATCSTPAMAGIVHDYKGDLPVHVVNDPAPQASFDELAGQLSLKLARAQSEQTLRLLWFGVGDNPHFDVGLNDLAAFGGVLGSLANSDKLVELTVLTNERALGAGGLTLLGRLPVKAKIEEWSEARERALLAEAFACFLPVNAQPFSAAKSLNRAVTALTAGCQAISSGYPLYEPLSELVYRDVSSFLADFDRGSMKNSLKDVERFKATMRAIASAETEAASLAEFFKSLRPAEKDAATGPLILVHGQSTNGAAHKAVHAMGGISVASPYCPAQLGFDVIFRGAPGELVMLVSDKTAKSLVPSFRDRLKEEIRISEKKYWRVSGNGRPSGRDSLPGESWHEAPLPFQLASYRHAIGQIRESIAEAFGPSRVILSENSQLPFTEAK